MNKFSRISIATASVIIPVAMIVGINAVTPLPDTATMRSGGDWFAINDGNGAELARNNFAVNDGAGAELTRNNFAVNDGAGAELTRNNFAANDGTGAELTRSNFA